MCAMNASASAAPSKGKEYGATVVANVAPLANDVPLRTFLAMAGKNCRCLERFVDKEVVYFLGDIDSSRRRELQIRTKPQFKVETRNSNVLVLSVKGKKFLSLPEAMEIVASSPLANVMHLVQLIVVPPKPKARQGVAHAYVQFADRETAQQYVNCVDALPYKGSYVHSPQLDAHPILLNESSQSRYCIWRNMQFGVVGANPLASLVTPADMPVGAATPAATTAAATPPAQAQVDDMQQQLMRMQQQMMMMQRLHTQQRALAGVQVIDPTMAGLLPLGGMQGGMPFVPTQLMVAPAQLQSPMQMPQQPCIVLCNTGLPQFAPMPMGEMPQNVQQSSGSAAGPPDLVDNSPATSALDCDTVDLDALRERANRMQQQPQLRELLGDNMAFANFDAQATEQGSNLP